MERYFFRGTLLVPVENVKSTCNFFWAGTLNGENIRIDVIAFKTAKKEDFVPLMKADLETLQKMEQTNNVKAQADFLESTLKEMADPVFIKIPDGLMLQTAQDLMSRLLWKGQRESLQTSFTPENTVFICGISGMSKD